MLSHQYIFTAYAFSAAQFLSEVCHIHFPSCNTCAFKVSPPTTHILWQPYCSFISLALFRHSLCSTWRWKAQNKNTFETVGRVKSRNRQNGKAKNNNRQKQTPKTKTQCPRHPLSPLFHLSGAARRANNNIINGYKMQGKLNFWVEFQWPLQSGECKSGGSGRILTHRVVLFARHTNASRQLDQAARISQQDDFETVAHVDEKFSAQQQEIKMEMRKKGEWIARQREKESWRERGAEDGEGVVARM